MKEKFDEIVNKNHVSKRVKVLSYTNQVPELMSISDLIVTKPGGMTTTEALASKLPMLIINPIPGQEEENAEFLENKKVAIWIKNEDNITEILNNLFDDEKQLQQMKENAGLLGHPYSSKEICDILLQK